MPRITVCNYKFEYQQSRLNHAEILRNVKFYVSQVFCVNSVIFFIKPATHCKRFYKYFVHAKLCAMRQKWRFIHMVKRSQPYTTKKGNYRRPVCM